MTEKISVSTIAGAISGILMRQATWRLLAPSTLAASYSSGGSPEARRT